MTSVTRIVQAGARRGEEGVALIVALLLTVALSAIGASLLLLAETETFSSMNYRMMSQARYGAESGVLRAVNHLMYEYESPGPAGDPLGSYDATVSPVTYNGQPVVLSAVAGVSSNYPVLAKQSAFVAAVQGTLDTGNTVSYAAHATLLSMRVVSEYGATSSTVIQTWRIVGLGTLAGNRPATVEVSSVLERNHAPALNFGVFATQAVCGAIEFGGGSVNDSYDSDGLVLQDGFPVTDLSGGRVGTNGNLKLMGNANIYGTLSTPRPGVGKCKDGAMTGVTEIGQAEIHEGMILLPQALDFPPPAPPNPMPPTNSVNMSTGTCSSLGFAEANCSGTAGAITLDAQGGTLLLGNVSLGSGNTLTLRAGNYNINSINASGGGTIIIETGPVVMNMAGVGVQEPVSMTAGRLSNPTFIPMNAQILYAGSGALKLAGGADTAAVIYAPNAHITVAGGSDFYGAILGATVLDNGGGQFHYDRSLQDEFFIVGNYVMSSFTWRKY
jgi:hypothetical protein